MKERGTRRYSDRERDVEKSKFLNEDIAFIFLQFSFYRKVRAHLCRTPKTEREKKKQAKQLSITTVGQSTSHSHSANRRRVALRCGNYFYCCLRLFFESFEAQMSAIKLNFELIKL